MRNPQKENEQYERENDKLLKSMTNEQLQNVIDEIKKMGIK